MISSKALRACETICHPSCDIQRDKGLISTPGKARCCFCVSRLQPAPLSSDSGAMPANCYPGQAGLCGQHSASLLTGLERLRLLWPTEVGVLDMIWGGMLSKGQYRLRVVVHTLNLSTWKTDRWIFFLVQDQSGLQSEFQDSWATQKNPVSKTVKSKQKEGKIKRKVMMVSSLNLTD